MQVLTTHGVVAYVNSHTSTLSPLKQQRLNKILEAPNATFTHEGINMADRMTTGTLHVFAHQVEKKQEK